MTWLPGEQLAALTTLQAVCGRQGATVVIIGAAAYHAWFDDPGRHTEDVDVAVAINLGEFERLAQALAGLGWRQELRREHRWITPEGARVDLLPAGDQLRSAGRIEWPRSGMVMGLVGFEHVFSRAVTREAAPGIVVRVIPVPVLALLKIAAFLESPYTRGKDAQDIHSIFDRYEDHGDRRFSSEVYDAGVDYERAGAWLLGRDLAALCSPSEADLVARFVSKVADESTPEAMIYARAPSPFEYRGEARRTMIAAFAAGLSGSPV
ncbi:hypothetical protein SBA4_120018 [Candidatus Sulfopaludibacter sp. SbA4]|nr:hypothetical protein SBA4_120018 [Candidatus Sulfopaludibacter sp. SbA4]